MGTRRSKHNKGRKPDYKDHRGHTMSADQLIAHGGNNWSWCWKYVTWSAADEAALVTLCNAGSDVEKSANVLRRPPATIAHRARDGGLTLPPEWAKIITPKRLPKERHVQLAYPYIIRPRQEHADILAVNALVPRHLPDSIRADVCQEILLALVEGRTSIDVLKQNKANTRFFIKNFYHDNFEQDGRAVSFDQLADDHRSYDEVAAAVARKDYHYDQLVERHRYANSLPTFSPATQFRAVWSSQVHDYARSRDLSFDEAEEALTSLGGVS